MCRETNVVWFDNNFAKNKNKNTKHETITKNNYTPVEVLFDHHEIKYYLGGSCSCRTCEKCLLVRLIEEM